MFFGLLCKITFVFVSTMIPQDECCLDILVRSFNEIFSPVIETGANRISEPHTVDDLTDYYKTDSDEGKVNFQPANDPYTVSMQQPHFLPADLNHGDHRTYSHKSSGQDISEKRKGEEEYYNHEKEYDDDEEGDDNDNEEDDNDKEEDDNDEEEDNDKEEENDDDEEEDNKYHKKTKENGYYKPGKRPLVDFLIRFMDMFQVTYPSKFVTTKPRYPNPADSFHFRANRYVPSYTYDS